VSKRNIYLDYAAATPLDQRVFKAMEPYFNEQFYNPSAPYQPARDVRHDIEIARASIAGILGTKPAEIIFTAGATESINLAFQGVLKQGGHCVVSAIEHQAILQTACSFPHTIVAVDSQGRIKADELIAGIRKDTTLVSIGMVNSEMGVIQDIKQISEAMHAIRRQRQNEGNTTPLYVHTDATQAAGLCDLSVARLGIDLLSLSSDKIYGPKQVGLLFKSSRVQLEPLLHGGGQEQNLRSGTENTPGIIGFAEAFRIATKLRVAETTRLTQLKNDFITQLVAALPETVILGSNKHFSPHILMVAWRGLDGERLVFRLENEGVLVNTGAACVARKKSDSHVLIALGLPSDLISGSLRFSFGRATTEPQLKQVIKIVVAAVTQERSL
jgi:cysteine desulfurase